MNSLKIQQNIDLTPFNTFGLPAKAAFFTAIQNIEELQLLLTDPTWQNTPNFILGGGSNILFTQNYPGLIIKNEIKGIHKISEDDESVVLKIGAGEDWHSLVMYCIEQGWGGIENLSLIPGTVGAAPIQNIGAYGVELKDVFQSLEAVKISDGSLQVFTEAQCQFGYRDSIFKSSCKNQFVIVTVTLRLNKKPTFNTSYGALHETLQAMHVSTLSLKAVSDAVVHIRRSKLPDPKAIGNAGSFFKNPVISMQHFAKLQKDFADIPHFPETSAELVKIPAAWLIEKCGWKGKRFDDVGVHEKQALVIVNYGKGTGAAIQKLAQQIQQSVHDRFGVQLTPEVNII